MKDPKIKINGKEYSKVEELPQDLPEGLLEFVTLVLTEEPGNEQQKEQNEINIR